MLSRGIYELHCDYQNFASFPTLLSNLDLQMLQNSYLKNNDFQGKIRLLMRMYKIRKKNFDTIGNFGIAPNSFSKLKEEKM